MTEEHPALWDCPDCGRGIMVQYQNRVTTSLYECTECPHLQYLPVPLEAWAALPPQDQLVAFKSNKEQAWIWSHWVVNPHDEQWRNANE